MFVLSPDAVASDVALKEIAHAASLNKRFAPIVCRRVEDGATPEALRRLNFIFFDDPDRFEASADQLAEALQTDIAWIRQHTEFGELARHWSAAGRPGGLLLRSPALEEAERWIASRPRGAPAPTEETRTFVADSRRGATRRRNILTGSLAAGLVVALALAGLAYWQRGIAVSSSGRSPNNSANAPKTRSRRRPRPPTVWYSTWRSASAPRREFPPVLSKTSSIARAPCRINSSNPGRRRRKSSAARQRPSPAP